MSDQPNLTVVDGAPDASGVVTKDDVLRGELMAFTKLIEEIDGQLAGLAVQRARTIIIRNALASELDPGPDWQFSEPDPVSEETQDAPSP